MRFVRMISRTLLSFMCCSLRTLNFSPYVLSRISVMKARLGLNLNVLRWITRANWRKTFLFQLIKNYFNFILETLLPLQFKKTEIKNFQHKLMKISARNEIQHSNFKKIENFNEEISIEDARINIVIYHTFWWKI